MRILLSLLALAVLLSAAHAQRAGWDDPPIDQETSFASVAVGPNGEVGFAYDYPTKEDARAGALDGCSARGFVTCRIVHEVEGPGVCVVIARDEAGRPFIASAPRCESGVPRAAEAEALGACEKAGGAVCLVYSAFCHQGISACIARAPDDALRANLIRRR